MGPSFPDGANPFNPIAVINESYTYGLFQLERRLDQIRTLTAIDYASLTEAQKTELKRIRKGAVYQNTDIIDSKNLFEASRTYLSENINPAITITIDTISILQAYEAQSDWSKVKIGEKVDIYVPDLKINVEAEIQEINIDFQNYKMGLTIATVQNYDKSFGKYFSNIFKLLTTNVLNEQRPRQSAVNSAVELEEVYGDVIEEQTSGGPQMIGSSTVEDPTETENNPASIEVNEVYIDPRTQRLVSRPPSWSNGSGGTFSLYGDVVPGSAKLTSGGLYIKDENDVLRVKLTARDGLVAEKFKIDLDGNATFSGTLSAGATLSDNSTTLASKLLSIDNAITGLGEQIDGAIDTFFGDGVPLPITTTYTGATDPTNPSEGET
jgi:hypothetical protein